MGKAVAPGEWYMRLRLIKKKAKKLLLWTGPQTNPDVICEIMEIHDLAGMRPLK